MKIGQAKLGQIGGFMMTLAWPGVLESQSQAIRPQLWWAMGTFVCGDLWLEIIYLSTLHGHTHLCSLLLFVH
jgi:hypothetical protein